MESAGPAIGAFFRSAKAQVVQAGLRTKRDELYNTLEDFTRMDDQLKRVLVIGCTGAGKSTLLNVMGGWRFVQRKVGKNYDFVWENKPAAEPKPPVEPMEGQKEAGAAAEGEAQEGVQPLFQSGCGSESVTDKTAFAHLSWFGDAQKPFIAIDTPGHDDSAGADIDSSEARDKLAQLAADLHNKIKAAGHIHAILVLHNDVVSNRLNPATYTVLKMVGEKFAKSGGDVWKHVIVGYSKCNCHESTWRSGLDRKITNLQAAIKTKLSTCEIDVPVIALGGGSIEPPPPHMDESDGFEDLWEFVQKAPPLDCSQLLPFEGVDVKWQQIVNARDLAMQQAKAANIYMKVMAELAALFAFMFVRAFMVPRVFAGMLATGMVAFAGHMAHAQGISDGLVPRQAIYSFALAVLMFNLRTFVDELALLALFVSYVGPNDLRYSLVHFNKVWLEPRFQLEEKFGKVKEFSVELYRKSLAAAAPPAATASAARQPAKEPAKAD